MPDLGARKACLDSLDYQDSRVIVDQMVSQDLRGRKEGRVNGASRDRWGLRGPQEQLFQHYRQSVNLGRTV